MQAPYFQYLDVLYLRKSHPSQAQQSLNPPYSFQMAYLLDQLHSSQKKKRNKKSKLKQAGWKGKNLKINIMHAVTLPDKVSTMEKEFEKVYVCTK